MIYLRTAARVEKYIYFLVARRIRQLKLSSRYTKYGCNQCFLLFEKKNLTHY